MHQGAADTALATRVGGAGLLLMTIGDRGAALAPVAPARWAFLMVHRLGLLIASAWGFVWHGEYPAPVRALIVAAAAWWLVAVVKGLRGPRHEAFNARPSASR